MRSAVILSLACAALIGCAAPQPQRSTPVPQRVQQKTWEPIAFKPAQDHSAAWNYQAQLDIPVFQCSLEATSGASMYRMGASDAAARYGASLNACRAHAYHEGDAAVSALKQANVSPKLLDLGKDLYAKWDTYLGSLSSYSGENQQAKLAYKSARDAFLSEEKFSK